MIVKAKKSLGQHFLTDEHIARKVVDSLQAIDLDKVLEIGPGMGVLTRYLLEHPEYETSVIEIDRDSVSWLKKHIPRLEDRIIEGDFLKLDLAKVFSHNPFAVIGNFPYNISSQIFFKILETRDIIPEVVCMLQEEVAQRICSVPGSKVYGILSVFLRAWYQTEYLFKVPPHVFNPPPKVQSAVIRLTRNGLTELGCNEKTIPHGSKAGFQSAPQNAYVTVLKAFYPELKN